MNYDLTDNWLNDRPLYWNEMIEEYEIRTVLELGSHEGASMIEFVKAGANHVTCIDLWEDKETMQRWDKNRNTLERKFGVTIYGIRDFTHKALVEESVKDSMFDMVYVDASHYPEDVILDASLAFRLLNVDGIILFDDYKWTRTENGMTEPDKSPKAAIDAFELSHRRLIRPVDCHHMQRCFQKIGHEDQGKKRY